MARKSEGRLGHGFIALALIAFIGCGDDPPANSGKGGQAGGGKPGGGQGKADRGHRVLL